MAIFSRQLKDIFAATVLSFAVIILLVVLYVMHIPVLSHLDTIAYNTLMTSKASRPVDPRIAIIDIDEKSLAQIGQWPWPRYILADVIIKLTNAGALAIGLDILQDRPDRNSPELIQKQLHDRYGATLNLKSLPPSLLNHDRYFSEVLAVCPVVLGMAVQYEGESSKELPPPVSFAEKKPDGAISPRERLLTAKNFIQPLSIFTDVAPVGTINTSKDSSGFISKTPLLFQSEEQIYAALSLRTLMRAFGKRSLRLTGNQDGLMEIGIGQQVSIAVEPTGLFQPVFRGPEKSYPYYSVSDVLNDNIDPKLIENRILLLGTSALGLMDIRSTPYTSYFPGVEAHATLIDNFLNGESVHELPYTMGLQILTMIIVGTITMFFFWRFAASIYVPIAIFFISGSIWGSFYAFEKGIFLSPIYVILTILAMAIHIIPIRFARAEMKRREIKRTFARYVAPEVVSRLTENNAEPLAGVQKEMTVLFTDIRGFTSISEKLAPTQMVGLLNQYFTPMTECVKKNEGTLDKFIGDALMAFWNAPLDVANHPTKAVKAALEMQAKLDELRPHFQEEFNVTINMGVGIHTGLAHVGNMGSNDLQDYTCIGDTVNLASRLEGMCKRYGVGIVVSADTVSTCDEMMHFRKLDTIRVKGKEQPATIFTPISVHNDDDIEKEHRWDEALDAYNYGKFESAQRLFENLLSEQPEYQTLIEMYIQRCQVLIDSPPETWQGAWNYDEK